MRNGLGLIRKFTYISDRLVDPDQSNATSCRPLVDHVPVSFLAIPVQAVRYLLYWYWQHPRLTKELIIQFKSTPVMVITATHHHPLRGCRMQ